jgi:hypothetical protein
MTSCRAAGLDSIAWGDSAILAWHEPPFEPSSRTSSCGIGYRPNEHMPIHMSLIEYTPFVSH